MKWLAKYTPEPPLSENLPGLGESSELDESGDHELRPVSVFLFELRHNRIPMPAYNCICTTPSSLAHS